MQYLKWRHPAAFLVLICLLSTTGHADAPARAPVNLLVNEGFARGEAGWRVPDSDTAYSTLAPAQAGPYRQALQVTVNPNPGDNAWDVALRQGVQAPLHKGDALTLKAWLRSPQSLTIGAFVEQNSGGHVKFLSGSLPLTPQWKEYELHGVSDSDYATGSADAIFHLGGGKGVVEITGIRLFNPDAPAGLQIGSGATPDAPVSLIENGDFAAPLTGTWTPAGAVQTEVVDAQPGAAAYKKALRLTTTQAAPDAPWTVQIGQVVQKTVGHEEALYFRAWMRSPDHCRVTAIYELARAPNTKSLIQTVQLTSKWKEYRFVGTAAQGFAPGESQAKLFIGQDKGVVEVAGLRFESYGQAPASLFSPTLDYYGGVDASDDWRAPALARIEKIRKADLTVQVVDAAGRLVPSAAVRVAETRSAFRWGTAAPADRLVNHTNPNNVRFQQEVKRLYNTVVLESDLKWQSVDANPRGVEKAEQAIAWLHANGIQVRGHNLVWGSWKFLPPQIQGMTADEERQAVQTRVQDFTRRFRGQVYVWDAVNEATNENDLWNKIGWENFANVYKWARAEDPNVLLAYNDYHALDAPDSPDAVKERGHIQELIDRHAPLDILGEQAHLGPTLIPISDILVRLDALAKFGKRIEITEFDLGVPDDAVHGRYVRDFLTAAFSQPSVDGFLQWGFWEGSHWRAQDGAAMFRRAWTPRPGELAYEDLVLHQWRTNVEGKTGAAGAYATRGFLGDYNVTVTAGGKTKTVKTTLTGAGQTVRVALP